MKIKNPLILFYLFIFFGISVIHSQQSPDTAFSYIPDKPAYRYEKGSVIMVDKHHRNFHTLDNRYKPFGNLLRNDGYKLEDYDSTININYLNKCRILVIANAVDSLNDADKYTGQKFTPSAYTDDEISTLVKWVGGGGRLFLIADHMPMPGCIYKLGMAFGFEFQNCYAWDNRRREFELFYKSNGTFADNEITSGIDTVVTFVGSGFKIPNGAKPIILLNENYTLLFPDNPGEFNDKTPFISGKDICQGAYMNFGKGKIVVFGEAGMFTAQIAGIGTDAVKFGFNSPEAHNNIPLIFNIVHWLDK